MHKEIVQIHNRIPNAETRTDVWRLEQLHRINSGECQDPEILSFFTDISNYYTEMVRILKELKNEISINKY